MLKMKIMKLTHCILLMVGLGVCNTAAAQTKQLACGDRIPAEAIKMRNANGAAASLKSQADKNGLLVMFSCNTCPFVIKNQQTTLKTIAYARAHNFGVVIINSNDARRDGDDAYDQMVQYAKKQGYTVPYLVDEGAKVADQFGANHTPEIFLFNKDGILEYKGAMNDNPGDPAAAKQMFITNAMDAVVAGKKPEPAETKSIGCSIQRKA